MIPQELADFLIMRIDTLQSKAKKMKIHLHPSNRELSPTEIEILTKISDWSLDRIEKFYKSLKKKDLDSINTALDRAVKNSKKILMPNLDDISQRSNKKEKKPKSPSNKNTPNQSVIHKAESPIDIEKIKEEVLDLIMDEVNKKIEQLEKNIKKIDKVDLEKEIASLKNDLRQQKLIIDEFKKETEGFRLEIEKVAKDIEDLKSSREFQMKFEDETNEKIQLIDSNIKAMEEESLKSLIEVEGQITAIKKETGKLSNGFSQLTGKTQKTFSDLAEKFTNLKKELETLSNKNESKKFDEISKRVSDTIHYSFRNKKILPKFNTPKKIQESLIDKNIAIPEKIIQDIILGLRRKNIVLVGPTGIGKTSLIENLSLFFEGQANDFDLIYKEVMPDWDSYTIVGGIKLVDNRLAPHLGIFTESLFQCIESNNTTVLVFDEFNKAKIDNMFGGLMTWLNQKDDKITIEDLKHVGEGLNSLKVPKNFRIIGVMNNAHFNQELLYSMSSQLKRRFKFINFFKPDIRVEKIVLSNIIRSHKEEIKKIKTINHKPVELFNNILGIVENIRLLEVDIKVEVTIIGTSYIVEAINDLGEVIKYGYIKTLDEIIQENFLDCFLGLQPNLKQMLISNIFKPFNLNGCIEKLTLGNI